VLAGDGRGRERLREALDGVRDLERLAGRAALGRATPREMARCATRFCGSRCCRRTGRTRGPEQSALLDASAQELDLLTDIGEELARALVERPPAQLDDGDTIRPGYDLDLDELKAARDGGKQYIAALQTRERERTGIGSLKVGLHKVFGYYIEVTHANRDRIPADYERRQTLTGAERYVTPDLKNTKPRSWAPKSASPHARRGPGSAAAPRWQHDRPRADDRRPAGTSRRVGRAGGRRRARALRASRRDERPSRSSSKRAGIRSSSG